MSIKSAVFEIKEALMKRKVGQTDEDFIRELEIKYELPFGTLVFYYNHLSFFANRPQFPNPSEQTKKINRKWTKYEMEFMFQYIKERQEEGALNITELLEEVAKLLDRGYQSVNYKYYHLAKVKTEQELPKKHSYHFTTIAEEFVPVLSAEVLQEKGNVPPINQEQPESGEDLLDLLSGLISNVQQLPGIHLTELLKSLYHLTNLALENREAAENLKAAKAEANREQELLKEKVRMQEQLVINEKKRNDELQREIAKLTKEIIAFNQLGDAAKIQNLKTYNQRLNYIIDESGLVLKVGS